MVLVMAVQINQDTWALGTLTTHGKHHPQTGNLKKSQVSVPTRIPDADVHKL